MNSFEKLIKERNSLSQKTHPETKSVCIIPEASERIPPGSPPGNPRIRNLPYGGCLCLPLFLSPFSPRDFSKKRISLSLFGVQRKKKKPATHSLPPWHPHHLQPSKPLPTPTVELSGPGLFLQVGCALRSAPSTLFGTA